MAIRSNVLQAEAASAPPSPIISRPTQARASMSVLQMALWIAGGVIASSAISGSRVPSAADIVLRLIIAVVVFGAMTLVLSWTMRESVTETFSRWGSVLPFAVGGAVIAAWSGLWNDGSGAVALPLGQAIQLIVTAGLTPMKLGPDVFLRFVTLLSIGAIVYRLGREGSRARQIRVAVTAWLVAAIVLLIPSFAASMLAISRGAIIATAQDALRVMGSALSNSYWSNFQQERFLTGIGDQLGVMVGFWTTAITFIVGVSLVVGFAAAFYREDVRRIVGDVLRSLRTSVTGWAMGGAVLVGYLIASTHLARTIQLVPIVLFVIALVALVGRLFFKQNAALFVGVCASALLGWPVLVAFVICAALCISAEQSQGMWQQLLIGVAGAAFVVLGAAFGVRSSMFPPTLAVWAVPMGVLLAGIGLIGPIGRIESFSRFGTSAMRELAVFCATLVLCAILMGFLTGVAVAALASLVVVAMQKKGDLWGKYRGSILLLAGWVMMGLKLFVS